MVYLGSGNYEFVNGVNLNINELKDILIDIYTSDDFCVQRDILKTISEFECVYTEEDLENAVEDAVKDTFEGCCDESDESYKEGYNDGYNDGVRELKQKYPHIDSIIEFYEGDQNDFTSWYLFW